MNGSSGEPAAASGAARERFLDRALALVPVLRERAPQAEALRRIPDETIRDLREAGLWRILRPARYGGAPADFGLMIDVAEQLGRGCGSTAWVYINIVAHNWMLPMWPGAALAEVWGENPEALIGSTLIFPRGRLEPVAGGYLLSGRWPYASGIDASDWMMLGGLAPPDEAGGGDRALMPLVRAADLEVIDTWRVAGLVGTGSKDVACEKLFVPAHMLLDPRDARGGPTPGSPTTPGAVYRLPVVALIPHLVASPMLGIARGAYEDHAESLRARTSVYNRSRLAEHTTVQLKLAEAGVLIQSARLLIRDNVAEAARRAEADERPSVADRARWRRDATHAAGCCVRAVDLIYAVNGGAALYLDNELQRRFRDVHAAAAQIHLSWDINGPEFGRVEAGLPPSNPNL